MTMEVAKTMESLRGRVDSLKESLHKSQNITDNMVAILGSFDHRLSALETAMRPTQIRTHSIRRAHENIDKTCKAAEVVLGQFDLTRKAEAKILRGPHEDLESYLEAIGQLRSTIKFFTSNKTFKSSVGVTNHANTLLAKAISKLEDEFRQLLNNYSKPMEPDCLHDCLPSSLRLSSDSTNKSTNNDNAVYKLPTLIPQRVIPLLHELVHQMEQAGHQQQLFKIYRDIRSVVLDKSLSKLGVERLSKDDVQKMAWEVLEGKIGSWVHCMRISVKILFAAEKKLCDDILKGMDPLKDQCYCEVTANSVAVLLSFGEAVAKSKRSPEKLFVLLDMYEIMRELLPDIKTLFGNKLLPAMHDASVNLTKRLAQTAQETFVDFEEAVANDVTKMAVFDGTVHPLTSYVINYVKFLFDYQTTLKQLFEEFECKDSQGQLRTITTRIMSGLQTNLEGKSRQYKDPALTQIFLMNNIHYMVRSVRRSEAKELLGDDWVQIHRRIVQQHANQYKRISWAKILQCVSVQGNSDLSRSLVKERFKNFNVQFEELYQRQAQWTVPDSELRESLRLAVAEVLLPAYRSFLKRFGPMIENGKNPAKYIRYSPDNLDQMLNQFFEGKTSVA